MTQLSEVPCEMTLERNQVQHIPDSISSAVLLLSRFRIEPGAEEHAREVCAKVTDWSVVIDVATRKFSIPFVYRNIAKLFPNDEKAMLLEQFRTVAKHQQMATLRLMSAQTEFHRKCILPVDPDYLYLKGLALAAQIHDDPGLRFSRDIDVLVGGSGFERVIEAAIDQHYKVLSNSEPRRVFERSSEIRAAIRYSSVVSILSPENVLVELHKEVDKGVGVFSKEVFFNNVVDVGIRDTSIRTAGPELNVCYSCYHNSRHLWSRLHWLADLSCMVNHSFIDLDAVREQARNLGLGPLVEACIDLDRLVQSGEVARAINPKSNAEVLLQSCLKNLPGDLELERQLRANFRNNAIPFRNMVRDDVYRRMERRHLAHRFAPSMDLYCSLPLPDWLQWAYYPMKPFYSLIKRIRK